MTGNSPSEKRLAQLEAVAKAAKALVESASDNARTWYEESVDEKKLTALESALEAAGYGMTDQEFEEAL